MNLRFIGVWTFKKQRKVKKTHVPHESFCGNKNLKKKRIVHNIQSISRDWF